MDKENIKTKITWKMNVLVFLRLLLISTSSSLALKNITGSHFHCPYLRSSEIPTSVHELRPADIKVVGTLGNSLITGYGALDDPYSGIFTPTDYKGLSWGGGGDGTLSYITTVPNILRHFNPNLHGFAEGTSHPDDRTQALMTNVSSFVMASHGAGPQELLQQAIRIVDTMRSSSLVDFENDWKMIIMYIDSNDYCPLVCENRTFEDPNEWITNVAMTLDYLSENLPRAYVNLVQMIDIGDLLDELLTSRNGQHCRLLMTDFVCNCVAAENPPSTNMFDYAQYRMNLEELVTREQYNYTNNFTVVLQPFMSKIKLEETDDDYLDISPFATDCIHLSPKGHRAAAVGLWNGMFEKVGNKSSTLKFPVGNIRCPTYHYFGTSVNRFMRFFARDIDIANPRTVLGDTTSIISSTSSGFMRHHCSAPLLLMMPTLQIVRTSLN